MSFRIVIPARYQSTRLPGKPLIDIAGKPLIQYVYERAMESGASEIIIATDDQRIADAGGAFGANVCMTSTEHTNGTERLSEVATRFKWNADDVIVNLQGDEPLMPRVCLEQVAQLLAQHPECQMATLCTPILDENEMFDAHVVKVVRDQADHALYFSRAPIPWHREMFSLEAASMPTDYPVYQRHIGLYAYRAGFLVEYASLTPSPLEQVEALEQLRALWHQRRIAVHEATEIPPPGVDTESDLKRVVAILTT